MRAKIWTLGVLGLGSAGGFCAAVVMMGSGCFLPFALKKAMADDTVIIACDSGTTVTNAYPGLTAEQFAGLSVVRVDPTGGFHTIAPLSASPDGKVTIPCGKGDQINFTMR